MHCACPFLGALYHVLRLVAKGLLHIELIISDRFEL